VQISLQYKFNLEQTRALFCFVLHPRPEREHVINFHGLQKALDIICTYINVQLRGVHRKYSGALFKLHPAVLERSIPKAFYNASATKRYVFYTLSSRLLLQLCVCAAFNQHRVGGEYMCARVYFCVDFLKSFIHGAGREQREVDDLFIERCGAAKLNGLFCFRLKTKCTTVRG
jgi:hypothetical protein